MQTKSALNVARAAPLAMGVEVSAEASMPVGTVVLTTPRERAHVAQLANDSSHSVVDAEGVLQLADESLDWFTRHVAKGRLAASSLGGAGVLGPNWKILLRLHVRCAELKLPMTADPGLWRLMPWPETAESVALLKRAAAVFSVYPATIPIGSKSDLRSVRVSGLG